MGEYIDSAIKMIYEGENDHIVIGLTGRTGSGCSTVAKILQCKLEDLHHSLHKADNPTNNDERKQKIIYRHLVRTWQPFQLIQVRSIISLLLVENDVDLSIEFIKKNFLGNDETYKETKNILLELKQRSDNISKSENSLEIIDFYTKYLPVKSEEIKISLGETIMVPLYQIIGKNIRLSGHPFNEETVEGAFFSLSKKINEIIAKLTKCNNIEGIKSLIVVDAIRNPLEAIFLQDRITNFHLVAVSCPEDQRLNRLASQNFSASQIKSIDDIEYTDSDIEADKTYSMQDIQGCLQRADIYLSNADGDSKVSMLLNLTNQIVRLISLMKRPGIITPTALERCMQIAYTAKLNSGCISRQVGALVTDKHFSVKAIGWNDTPHGQVPCNLRNRDDLLNGLDGKAYSNYEKNNEIYLENFRKRNTRYIKIAETGRNVSYCFKSEYNSIDGKNNQVHTRSLHAEENAFLQISKYGGQGIYGGFLFTTASPCELCAKKAYQLGIERIYYIDPYPGISISHILEGGTSDPYMELFSGAIGRSFHKLYTPIMAYKDELNALGPKI